MNGAPSLSFKIILFKLEIGFVNESPRLSLISTPCAFQPKQILLSK